MADPHDPSEPLAAADAPQADQPNVSSEAPGPEGRRFRMTVGRFGAVLLAVIALPCVVSLPWTIKQYNQQVVYLSQDPPITTAIFDGESRNLTDEQREQDAQRRAMVKTDPKSASNFVVLDADDDGVRDLGSYALFGRDSLGRSMTSRCLLGGAISLGIGLAAAFLSLVIGVTWGATAGYFGGRVDSIMMRIVDVLYGLPYILLVVLIDIAIKDTVSGALKKMMGAQLAEGVSEIVTLLIAIGAVSWLTMARVIRGQVLSLREQPFIEASRAAGAPAWHVMLRHLLPNLVGPIVVYTTLTVPQAILQESFLSFLGIGVQLPLPSWGNLASEGISSLHALGREDAPFRWWLIVWPCALLGLTLLALNYLGEALRERVDPRSNQRKH